jgi:type IV pilus assembly protein PilC
MATTATSESFVWSGTDKNGRQTKGEINASSQAMARAQLRQKGINPKSVTQEVQATVQCAQKADQARRYRNLSPASLPP